MSTRRTETRRKRRSRIKYASQNYNSLSKLHQLGETKENSLTKIERKPKRDHKSRSSLALEQNAQNFLRPTQEKKKKKNSGARKSKRLSIMMKGSSSNHIEVHHSREHGEKRYQSFSKKGRKKKVGGDADEILRLNAIIDLLKGENEVLKEENRVFREKFQLMKEIYSEVAGSGKKNKKRRDLEDLLSTGESDTGSKNEKSLSLKKEKKRKKIKNRDRSDTGKGSIKRKKNRKSQSRKNLLVRGDSAEHPLSSRNATNAASESIPAFIPNYFGIPLNQVEVNEDNVPQFMEDIVEQIVSRGLDIEGILRVSGSSSEIRSIKNELDAGEAVDMSQYHPNTLAGLFKLFFRSMPTPIIPPLFNAQIPLILEDLKAGIRPEEEIISDFKDVVYSLPEPNFSIYQLVSRFLYHVWRHEAKNKMNLNNILTCICPSIRVAPALLYYSIKFNDFFSSKDAVLTGDIEASETVFEL